MSRYNYVQIPAHEAPGGIWHTNMRDQGQIVEVSYADASGSYVEAGPGDMYQRIHDRSDGSIRYYRLAEK